MLHSPDHNVSLGSPDNFQISRTDVVPILLQYWEAVFRWKWVIAGILLATLIAALIFSLLSTPQYTATSRIEISREDEKVTNVQGVGAVNAAQNQEFYQTQYALLEARTIAERVARQLRLASNDGFFEAHGVTPEDKSGIFASNNGVLSASDRQKREKVAVSLLQDNILVSPIRGSALIDVRYTSANARLSTQISNAWTKQFIEASIDRRFAATADARTFLEERLADLRDKLEKSERDLVNYASEKGIVALSRNQAAQGEKTLAAADLEALNKSLADAIASRIAAESRVRVRRPGGSSDAAIQNVVLNQLRQRRAEAASNYAKLMVRFEPGYPEAKALEEQIRVYDVNIAREEARVANARIGKYREALILEKQLKNKVEEFKSNLDLQRRDSIQYNIFLRETDSNRTLYNSFLQRFKEIGVAGVGANNIAIVDEAQIPEEPSSPNLLLNLALGFLGGIGIAAAAVFGLEQLDEGIRDPGQVTKLLGVPLLGGIPSVDDGEALDQLSDAKSVLSEAYLSVRSNLAFLTDHGIPKSLIVTSTRPAEGKSTSSFAIATLLGRTGKRVLIIDADMRYPSIQDFVGVPNDKGFSNFLAGDDNWQELIEDTGIVGLSLMTAGPKPPSAAELLSGDRAADLVKELSEHYEHIIIDAPPILGLADAPLLSRVVEGCIFVAEAEGVAVRGIQASLNRLRDVQAHIFGLILTKLSDSRTGYGYGYGYGYGQPVDEEG